MKNFYWGRRELPKKTKKIKRYHSTRLNISVSSFFAIMVAFNLMLFSRSVLAQSSNKKAAAGSVQLPKAIVLGQKVPAEFWDLTHTLYENGKTREITLREFKGKTLVLDFWSVNCGKCIFHQKAISYFKDRYSEDLKVIMVNPKRTKDSLEILQSFEQKYREEYFPNGLSSIVFDESLTSIFTPTCYPTYVWINTRGFLQTITFWNFLDKEIMPPYIWKGEGK